MRPFIQNPTLKRYQVHRDLAILLVTVAVCAVPFLNHPFHMDDNFYMDMARNARIKPLYPNDTSYVFAGHYAPDMGSHTHPPFQTYFLALLQHFFGEGAGREWIYHVCSLVFPILGVLAFYFVAARFLERPLWPSMVLACCPLFLVMQHTLMTDVPTLAFWLAAIACFLWATDRRSTALYAASSLFQFAAMFASYQSIALTPLLGAYQLRKKAGLKGWCFLLLAPLAMAVWFVMNFFHYRRWLLVDTLGYIQSRHAGTLALLWTKLLAILEYQGWLILFPLFLLYVFGRGLRWRFLALVTLIAIYLCQLRIPDYRFIDKIIFVVGLVTGIFVIWRMVAFFVDSFREGEKALGIIPPEAQFLGLWYFGVLAYCVLLFTEGSARYILPLVPPVMICFFRQLEVSEVSEYRLPSRPLLNSAMLASGSLVISLAWGMALSQADQEFSRIYPRAAYEFSRITNGMTSYYAGEWGFRYYFNQSGAQQLPVDESRVRGGSFLALPKFALPYDIPADLRTMTMLLQTLTYELATPLRTLDWQTPAGFYSTGWGLIPFSLSRRTLEEVEIAQVSFLVERLPWSRVDSSVSVKPWPGYLSIQEKAPLAVLAKPGTSIIYPWTEAGPLVLEMSCGVGADAYTEGSDSTFTFSIRELDSGGRILNNFSRTLKPGMRKEDRGWFRVRLLLQGREQGAESLELVYQSSDKNSLGTGAFAEAILRRIE